MLKKNQEMLKKAKAELMVITEAMSNNDKPVNIVEKPMMDPVALLETVDQMIEQLNKAKSSSDGTTWMMRQLAKWNDGPVRASSTVLK